MRLIAARLEEEARRHPEPGDRVLWLGPQPVPESVAPRAVPLPPDPPVIEGWLAVRRLGDESIGGTTVKDLFAYQGVSLWWFLHYWIVYGHGFTGWDERYRTLVRVLAGIAAKPSELVLVSDRAEDDVVARTVAAAHGIPYRWAAPITTRVRGRLFLRWGAEVLFRLRLLKLVLRGFLARRMQRNSLAGRGAVDIVFNSSSSTWDLRRATDRVLGPVIEEAEKRGLTVVGLHLDHRRNLGLDSLRRLDRRIVAWESLVTPALAIRAVIEGRRIAKRFGGKLPGEVLGISAASLLSDRLPVLFGARLADSILAIETCREAFVRLRPKCVYIVDAYDLWGRALVVAARQQGIRSVEVQHGIIGESHDGYLHLPGEVDPNLDQKTPFSQIPDAVAVHGQAAKDALVVHGHYPPRVIEVTGSPQVEAIRNRNENRQLARASIGLDQTATYALFFSAPYHVFPVDETHLRAFIACCKEIPAIKPILRPHPAEYSQARFVNAAVEAGIDAPVLTVADPFELIVAADIVLSYNSTTALDAMVLGRPVIHINMSGTPDMFPFVEEGHAVPVTTQAELAAALEMLTDPAMRADVARREEPYAGHYYARTFDPPARILAVGLSTLVPT